MSDIEDIREQKLRQLKEQAQSSSPDEQEASQKSQEEQIESILKNAATDDARQRLNAVEMTKPDLANEVKRQIVKAYQSGQPSSKLTEEKMRDILADAHEQTSKNFNINRR